MQIQKNKNVRWIDVARPKDSDLASLKKMFGLHPLIVEELREPSARARVESTKDYLYFIYYLYQSFRHVQVYYKRLKCFLK